MRKGKKETNSDRMLRVFRQLTPEHRAELLELARRVYTKEKSFEHMSEAGGFLSLIQQEYSCRDILQRSNE